MLSILLALIHEPEIIFLDELTTGLDPLNRRKVWDLLKKINKDKEVSILLTSHSMEEIEYLADRILILHEGEKIFLGGVNEAVRRYSEGEKNIEFTLKDPLQEFKLMKYDGQKLKERRYCIRTRDEEEVITYLYREVGVEALKVENLTLEDVFLKVAGYTLDERGRKRA